jgi:cell division protein FtsL
MEMFFAIIIIFIIYLVFGVVYLERRMNKTEKMINDLKEKLLMK